MASPYKEPTKAFRPPSRGSLAVNSLQVEALSLARGALILAIDLTLCTELNADSSPFLSPCTRLRLFNICVPRRFLSRGLDQSSRSPRGRLRGTARHIAAATFARNYGVTIRHDIATVRDIVPTTCPGKRAGSYSRERTRNCCERIGHFRLIVKICHGLREKHRSSRKSADT